MALTKVTKTGISDNSIDADKIEDGTIVAADIAPGTITNAKLAGSIANDKLANSSITVNGSSVSLGGSVSAGKVEWQAVKTADFNAVAGEGYFVDTDSVGAVTATLPGSPSAGDTIAFKDYAANFGTNALTIARNGNNIQGVANDSEISTNRASIVLVYIDGTKGWLYTNESNVADLVQPLFTGATGGTITTSGDYKIHSFTGDGCFVVSTVGNNTITPTGGPNTVSYLVVAGGGSGGGSTSGGAGAGGFREGRDIGPSYTASPLVAPSGLTISATTYPVTVGAGGAGGATNTSGSPSIFSTITSAGGGKGVRGNGQDGGSGSGSSGGPGGPSVPGLGNTPPVSPPQGSNGGIGQYSNCGSWRGAGGGGATVAGANATPSAGGNGGNGATTSISGSPTTYAGGGGGAAYPHPAPTATSGGTGGGGAGGIGPSGPGAGVSGTVNTGGGAGGSYSNPGTSTGGSGIVIIRYKFQ
jgi:hypothetical protein